MSQTVSKLCLKKSFWNKFKVDKRGERKKKEKRKKKKEEKKEKKSNERSRLTLSKCELLNHHEK